MDARLKTELLRTVTSISEKYYPDELEQVNALGEVLIEDMDNNVSQLDLKNAGHYEFALQDASAIISSFSVLMGTFKTFMDIIALINKKKVPDLEILKTNWKNELLKAGLSDLESEEIVRSFSNDVKTTFDLK